eukprot:s983_g28.t1
MRLLAQDMRSYDILISKSWLSVLLSWKQCLLRRGFPISADLVGQLERELTLLRAKLHEKEPPRNRPKSRLEVLQQSLEQDNSYLC